MIVPDCPDEAVKSANVIDMSGATIPEPSWAATGFVGDLSRGVVFDSTDWSVVHGDYAGLASFQVAVETGKRNYATVVTSPADLEKVRSIPKGTFFVNGNTVTAADYQASVAKDFPCSASTS